MGCGDIIYMRMYSVYIQIYNLYIRIYSIHPDFYHRFESIAYIGSISIDLCAMIAPSAKELCQCLVLENAKVNQSKTKGQVPDPVVLHSFQSV